MVKHNLLTQTQFEAMRDQPLRVQLNRPADPLAGPAPHFAAYVRKWLNQWADEHGYNLATDGLVIESTLDDRLQDAAARAVERQTEVLQNVADVEWGQKSSRVASQTPGPYASLHKRVEPFRYFWEERRDLLDAFIRETPNYKKAIAAGRSDAAALAELKSSRDFMTQLRAAKTRLEAGFLAMDPNTGEVRAWIGSRDFDRDQFDHVAQAERQPGSTFKPIVYAAALEQGMPFDKPYEDGPVEIRSVDGSIWRPTDMSGTSGRMMTLRDGLVYSKNTITARVMQDVGLPSIIELAKSVGVTQSKLDPVPSLSLGTSPVTLMEMVSAYSTIAKVGEYHKPVVVRRITDRNGRVLAEFSPEGRRALSEESAIELIDMMRGVVRQGTGTAVRTQIGIAADLAGKTGTTQNNTDGWFILMHPDLVAGAWVGFNDSRVTMRSDYWGQGGHNAVMLVGDFFKDTLKSKLVNAKAQFPKPKHPAPPPPPPLIVQGGQAPSDPIGDWIRQQSDIRSQPLPPGYGLVTSRNGDTYLVGPDGVRKIEKEQSAQASVAPSASGGSGTAPSSMADGDALSRNRPQPPASDAVWDTLR
jgi:penicillin-binding protein 1A